MNDFMINALLASFGLSLLAGPIGSLMMWKRVACLGDTLSHGAILGLSLGLLIGIEPMITLTIITAFWVLLLWFLNKNQTVSTDTAMAFLTHSSLAISIVLFACLPLGAPNLMEAFIGNILTVNLSDILLIYAMDAVFIFLIALFWKKWVLIAIHPDLARAEHIHVSSLQVLFLMMIGLFIAFSIKMMGALLVPAFLIIPAMTARAFSKTPEQMAIFASIIALISSALGLYASYIWDIPTAPMMVCLTVIFYLLTQFLKQLLRIKWT